MDYTPSQHAAMLRATRSTLLVFRSVAEGESRPSVLGARLGTTHQNVTNILARLVKRGLIQNTVRQPAVYELTDIGWGAYRALKESANG